MKASSLLIVGLALVFAAPVQAQEDNAEPMNEFAPYFSLTGGASFWQDSELEGADVSNSIEFETGWTGRIAVGTGYFSDEPFCRIRLEAELGFLTTDIDGGDIAGTSVANAGGDVSLTTLMANLVYDVPLASTVEWYIGGGAGVGYAEAEISGTVPGVGSFATEEDHDVVFVGQFLTGLGFPLTDNVTLTVGYRLTTTSDPQFDTGDYDSPFIHIAEIGLRVRF